MILHIHLERAFWKESKLTSLSHTQGYDEQACAFTYKSSFTNFLINSWQINFIAKITIHCASTNKLVQTDIKLLLLTCKTGTVIPKLPL